MTAPDAGSDPGRGVTIRGGAGGTLARIEDIDRAAGCLLAAADHLEDAARRAAGLDAVVDASAAWSPLTGHPARAELSVLRSPTTGLAARAALARRTSENLRTVARTYAEADRDAAQAVSANAVRLGTSIGQGGPVAWLLTAAVVRINAVPLAIGAVWAHSRGRLTASMSEQLVGGLGAFALAALPGDPPPARRPVRQAAAMTDLALGPVRGMLGGQAQGQGTRLAVARTLAVPPTPGAPPPRPPRSTGEVLEQVAGLYPAQDGSPGAVGVQRLEHADGTRSWVVTVPGTQEMSPVTGPNPSDLTSNLRLMAGRPDDVSLLVEQAMRQAGIAPDEPVLLAGHSQGGMAAMAVAGDPALTERFTVAAVVTAGSPVGAMALPDGVPALHIEHRQDHVTALDGAPNPAGPNRTTAVVDLGTAASPTARAAGLSAAGAHGSQVYAESAQRLAAVPDPSLQRFEQAVGGVLGDGTATVAAERYTGVRVAVGRP